MTLSAGIKKYVIALMMISLFVATSFNSMAQDSSTPVNKPQLKLIGNMDDKLVFQLDYQPLQNGIYTLEIVDQDGYELYRERSSERNFKKQFAIAKTDLANNIISVVINSKEGSQKFDINRSLHTVEDIRIVRQ